MRAFPVPVQISEEEKIIGGYLTLPEFLFLLGGFIFGGLSFALSFLPVVVRLFLFLLIFSGAVCVAFLPIKEMPAEKFLFYYLRWKRKPKKIFYGR